MSKDDAVTDLDLLHGFLEEARDSLEGVMTLLVTLEGDPQNLSLVDSIFRAVHSVKGNAPFFRLFKLKEISHEMESVLQRVRDRTLQVDPLIIKPLLRGIEASITIINRVVAGRSEIEDANSWSALLRSITEIGTDHSSRLDKNTLERFRALCERAPKEAPTLAPELLDLLRQLTPSPTAAPDGASNDEIGELEGKLTAWPATAIESGEIEELLLKVALISEGTAAAGPVASALESFRLFMQSIGFDALLKELLLEKLEEARGLLKKSQLAPPIKEEGPPGKSSQRTMRVHERHVDTFLAYVGELLIVGEMLDNVTRRFDAQGAHRELVADLKIARDTFSSLSQTLQQGIMSIRKVPVKSVSQKIPVLVRDIAEAKGKEISVKVIGEDIEVDKSLIELIDAPLTHMVRNGADHGIERPETRLAAGKKRGGTITVSFEERQRHIALIVEDDGAGINLEALSRKASSLGIIQVGAELTNAQLVDLLFMPGVSTAEEVSDISGRGVGMDVVKQMIEGAGGSISVRTVQGKGTTFTLLLNKSITTQIMHGFFFEIEGRPFIFPLEKVLETFYVDTADVHLAPGGRERWVVRHDQTIPLLDLERLLSIRRKGEEDERLLMVSVVVDNQPRLLPVTKVLGVNQFVLKSVDTETEFPFKGASILGDGRLALVFDGDKMNAH